MVYIKSPQIVSFFKIFNYIWVAFFLTQQRVIANDTSLAPNGNKASFCPIFLFNFKMTCAWIDLSLGPTNSCKKFLNFIS